MKTLSKNFTFRSYIIGYYSDPTYDNNSGYLSLNWCTKANSHYRMAGRHNIRIYSREDAAKKLNILRNNINAKYRSKKLALEEKRMIKKTFSNPYTVGQILHTSWGYDQTNIDYFQVVAVGKMSITVCEINASCKEDGFMTGNAIPKKDNFCGKPEKCIIQVSKYGNHVKVSRDHYLYPVSETEITSGIRSSWYA